MYSVLLSVFLPITTSLAATSRQSVPKAAAQHNEGRALSAGQVAGIVVGSVVVGLLVSGLSNISLWTATLTVEFRRRHHSSS
jgi:hypothetical protein